MLQIMRRELLTLIKKRHAIFFVIIGAAGLYALLFGNLYRRQIVQSIPVAICDLDESALSRELMRTISETDQFEFIGNLTSEIEAVKILERGQAAIAVVIPRDFSRNFYTQQPTEIVFLQDGTNIAQINYSTTPINLIVGTFAARYNQQASPTLSPNPISISIRTIGNNVQGYLEFYIYGVILMAAHAGITLGFGLSIFADKKNPACATVKYILAKEILYLLLSLFSVMAAITLLAIFFDLPFRGEIWQMLLISAAFLYAGENLAGLLGLFFKTPLSLVQVIAFYTLPALLTAGYIWPEHAMPPVIKFLSVIQPVHYALADFRRLTLTGIDTTFFQHTGILFLFGFTAQIFICIFARRRFNLA